MADSPAGQQLVDLEKYVKDLDNSALVFYGPVTSIRPRNEEGIHFSYVQFSLLN